MLIESIFAAAQAPAASLADDLAALQRSFIRAAQDVRAADPETLLARLGLTAAAFAAAFAIAWLSRRALTCAAKRMSPKHESRDATRTRLGKTTLSLVQLGVAIWALAATLTIWGVDLRLFGETAIGSAFQAAMHIALIVLLTTLALEISEFTIHMTFERWRARSDTRRRAAQVSTLAPITVYIARSIILCIAGATILASVGINVGPLLAGAGVVGIAVGFGAQTLVKDIITGFFLIAEDVVSVGDTVRIREFRGAVERMTLRTIRLRDFDGALHIIPYSEAQTVSNLTKDFSYYVFDISVGYSTDLNAAQALMGDVGDALQKDAIFGPIIMSPIEVLGVDRLADSGVTLKARVKTIPGKQWLVGREYLKRIKAAFDDAGIEIPFPHLKIVAPEPNAPSPSDQAD